MMGRPNRLSTRMVAIADRSPARYIFELHGGNAERPA
jgi:hypothetical protein